MDFTACGHLDENIPLLETHFRDITRIYSSSGLSRSQRIHKVCSKETRPLPLVLQVTLVLLGLWTPLRKREPTKMGVETKHSFVSKAAPINTDSRSQQELWDDDSSSEYLSEDDDNKYHCSDGEIEKDLVREDKKSCLISDVFAFLYLLLSCSLMTYDFQRYMRLYWGKKQNILHLVSYFTFLFQVMVIPFWCFYARLLYLTLGRRYREGYPLFHSFVSTRVTVLTSSRFGAKGLSWFRLLCFLAWPVTNAILRFANDYSFPSCHGQNFHKELGHWNALIGYIFYGCFCYLIHIERVSFECEVRHISDFARKQAPLKNVDKVRRRITRFYAHYNLLRQLIKTWMAFTIVVATWGLTAHLTWNYLVFSDKDIDPGNLPALHFLNVLISTQKIMFFVVPCVAIGGFNLEHVWKRFKYEIAKNKKYPHEAYWETIGRYMYQINVDHSGDLTPTLIFTAIGFYLGLNLGSGDQEYTRWIYPRLCNASHHPSF